MLSALYEALKKKVFQTLTSQSLYFFCTHRLAPDVATPADDDDDGDGAIFVEGELDNVEPNLVVTVLCECRK